MAFVALLAGCSDVGRSASPSLSLGENTEETATSGNDDAVVDESTTAPTGVDSQGASSNSVTTNDATQPDNANDGAVTQNSASEESVTPEADDAATDSPTTTTATASTDTSSEPRSEQDLRIDELIAFVEAERGHEFTERPSIELMDNAAFGQAWVEVIAEDVAVNGQDYIDYTSIYTAMGVIEGDRSLEEIWLRFGDAGVIGFYDTRSKAIKLRTGEFTAFTETVLVHELVHALEDQVFGLNRPQYANGDDELEWTFSALAEGSARRIETRFRATFTADQLAEENAARQAIPRTVSLSEFNPSFLELQFGRYRFGEEFATTVWNDSPETFDELFASPPIHSEAIIDPASFLNRSLDAQNIAAPPADGDVFESGTWGQAGWAAVFADVVDRSEAEAAAQGWDGDSFVAWRQSGETCVRAHLAADSADQLDDFADMLEDWADQDGGREIFFPNADLIRVTACG